MICLTNDPTVDTAYPPPDEDVGWFFSESVAGTNRNDQAARYAVFFSALFDAVLGMPPADVKSPVGFREQINIGKPKRMELYRDVVSKARAICRTLQQGAQVRIIRNTRSPAN